MVFFNWMSLLHVSFLSALVGCAGAPFTRARRACHQQSESHYLLSTALKLRGGARLLPGSGSRLTTVGRPRHAAARLSVPLGPMVVALDFDGVCLDSEPEASRVAWRSVRAVAMADRGVQPHRARDGRVGLRGPPAARRPAALWHRRGRHAPLAPGEDAAA